jgi:hypothetical protein
MKLAATRNALRIAIPKAVISVSTGISNIGPATLISSKTTSKNHIFI